MKKIILSIILCLMLILSAFSETTVNTIQLNKQGWEYINRQDYNNALKSFITLYKQAKNQQDYKYVMLGFYELIKNKNVPDSMKIDLCLVLQIEKFDCLMADPKLSNLLFVLRYYKLINILAKTDANDKIFTDILKTDKQAVLNQYKESYIATLDSAKTPSENAIARLYYALYEYSIGNKKLGMGQIENESNKILKYGSDFDGENSIELVNLVFDLCR